MHSPKLYLNINFQPIWCTTEGCIVQKPFLGSKFSTQNLKNPKWWFCALSKAIPEYKFSANLVHYWRLHSSKTFLEVKILNSKLEKYIKVSPRVASPAVRLQQVWQDWRWKSITVFLQGWRARRDWRWKNISKYLQVQPDQRWIILQSISKSSQTSGVMYTSPARPAVWCIQVQPDQRWINITKYFQVQPDQPSPARPAVWCTQVRPDQRWIILQSISKPSQTSETQPDRRKTSERPSQTSDPARPATGQTSKTSERPAKDQRKTSQTGDPRDRWSGWS